SRLRVADGIVRAIALARAGDLKGANALIDTTIKLATTDGKRFDDKELADKAKEATKLKGTLPSLVPPPPPVVTLDGMSPPLGPPRPVPPPLPPSAALDVRAIHGQAMTDLQR